MTTPGTQIEVALAELREEYARELLHRLHSTAGSHGFHALGDAAVDGAVQAPDPDWEEIRRRTDALHQHLAATTPSRWPMARDRAHRVASLR